MNANEIVRAALFATPIDHLEKCFTMRNPGPKSQGSTFTREIDVDTLLDAPWETFEHKDIQAPAKGFKTDAVGGHIGVIALENLPADLMLRVIDSRKEPGKVEVAIDRQTMPYNVIATYTTLLVGPGDQGKDIIWTFFPGDPIAPTALAVEDASVVAMPVEAAQRIGFRHAKVEG